MKRSLLFLLFIIVFWGCGGYNSGTIVKTEKAFLKFVGNTNEILFSVDDTAPISIDSEKYRNIELYEVTPGKHSVKVFRNNKLIINRQIFVDSEIIFEIEVK